jgi:hypothetical protein
MSSKVSRRHLNAVYEGVYGRDVTDHNDLLYPRDAILTPWTTEGNLDKKIVCDIADDADEEDVASNGTSEAKERNVLVPRYCADDDGCKTAGDCLFIGCRRFYVDCAVTGIYY